MLIFYNNSSIKDDSNMEKIEKGAISNRLLQQFKHASVWEWGWL
jgi:hypothetical protein